MAVDRRRRRGVRPAPEGLRRRSTSGADGRRGRAQGPRQGEPRLATRCRARSSSSTSCRATRPARSSSASWPSASSDARRARGRSPTGRRVVLLLAVVALAAAVVQAATGLGFALVLSPAVFALLEPESAVVAITVLGLALNGLVLFGERRRPRVAWGEVRPILVASIPGAVCGVLILRALPKSVLQIAVGVAVIGAAALRARARRDGGGADARRSARAAGARLRHGRAEHVGGRQRAADRAVVRAPRAGARRDPRLAERRLPGPRDHRRRRAGAGAGHRRRRGRLGRARRRARVRGRRPRRRTARLRADRRRRYEPLLLAIVVAAGAASVVAGVITAST